MLRFLTDIFIPKDETPAKRRESVGKFAGIAGIVLNALLCGIKAFAGFVSGSVAIVADAVNNLSDALTSVITVVCFKLSGKPADKDHPYGHERIEYVISLFMAFLIMFIGYELIKTSFVRILNPVEPQLSTVAIVVLSVSVVIKFIMNRMYAGYAAVIDSSVLRAAAQDSINDALSTFALLVTNIISVMLRVSLDGYAGLVVSLFIIRSGICIIKEAMGPILGSPPDKEMMKDLRERILSFEGVIGVHDLVVHSYGPNKTFATVHAEVDAAGDILQSHDLIDNIEREISAGTGIELVIHMDPIVTDDERVDMARNTVMQIVSVIDPVLSIHDFRIVPGNTHTNLIFDVVLPFDFALSQNQVLEIIEREVKETMGKEYFCVVSFDRDYA